MNPEALGSSGGARKQESSLGGSSRAVIQTGKAGLVRTWETWLQADSSVQEGSCALAALGVKLQPMGQHLQISWAACWCWWDWQSKGAGAGGGGRMVPLALGCETAHCCRRCPAACALLGDTGSRNRIFYIPDLNVCLFSCTLFLTPIKPE